MIYNPMQQGMQPMQQQLPFSATNMQYQPLHFDINNPPACPDLQVEDFIRPSIRAIAGMLAQEITQKAQTSNLRMFMFNQMMNNNFMNNEFAELVKLTVDYIVLMVMYDRTHSIQNLQGAANDAVMQMTACWAVRNITIYPALESFLTDQQQVANAQQVLQFLNNLAPKLQQLQMARQGQMQQAQGFGVPGHVMQQGNASFYNPAGGGGVMMHNPSMPQAGGLIGGMGTTGLLQNNPSLPNQQSHDGSEWGGRRANRLNRSNINQSVDNGTAHPAFHQNSPQVERWGTTDMHQDQAAPMSTRFKTTPEEQAQFDQRREQVMQEQQKAEKQVVKKINAAETDKDFCWVGSEEQPYPPAWAPATQNLFYIVYSDGTMRAQIEEKSEQEKMDWDLHDARLSSAAPRAFRFVDSEKRQQKFKDAVTTPVVNIDASKEEEITIPAGATVSDLSDSIEQNLDDAWTAHLVESAVCNKDDEDVVPVYRSHVTLVTPLVDVTDADFIFLKKLQEQRSYLDVQQVMLDYTNTASRFVWNHVEEELTKAINQQLVNNLSFTTANIDSFFEDIGTLIAHLNKKAKSLGIAFLENQVDTLRAIIGSLDTDETKSLGDEILAAHGYEAGTVKIAFMKKSITLTNLSVYSEELNLGLDKKSASTVVPRNNPELSVMLETLFESDKVKNGNFAKHYFRTRDGLVLEAHRGFLGKDFYNLSLSK